MGLPALNTFKQTLEVMKPQIKKAYQGLNEERFARVALTTIQHNPKILDCDQRTIFGAMLQCASDGLFPNGKLAAMVPYGKDCVYMRMFEGDVAIAYRSGKISKIEAHIVYENEDFNYEIVSGKTEFSHKPVVFGDRGEIIGVYTLVTFADQTWSVCPLSKDDVEKVRSCSKQKNGPTWTKFWGEMAKKTCFRRHLKLLPKYDELSLLSDKLDNEFAGDFTKEEEVHPAAERGNRLQAAMGIDVEPEEVEALDVESLEDVAPMMDEADQVPL